MKSQLLALLVVLVLASVVGAASKPFSFCPSGAPRSLCQLVLPLCPSTDSAPRLHILCRCISLSLQDRINRLLSLASTLPRYHLMPPLCYATPLESLVVRISVCRCAAGYCLARRDSHHDCGEPCAAMSRVCWSLPTNRAIGDSHACARSRSHSLALTLSLTKDQDFSYSLSDSPSLPLLLYFRSHYPSRPLTLTLTLVLSPSLSPSISL